ncbi:hypothetical protein Ae201684P_014688 [Aphanomyces euteiches]|uniref:Mitochondrial carrier protein n=1 Tax=Aphanomyces euteiches TaxID=100861 RepID=A0A6G0WXZ8_9STRA|nr:hypothetical protein Ae201684_010489 [Aphanomyces euteiches]KAH9089933.1 hypothetical protein Ae201684P_014688 [Aphanomyces euteiches]KAH9135524.1 hypothetical protein AeRB84_019086 [Aphanomyces euteiches]KAH9150027.1 hypothetical protein AeRB84_007063 [Aphanomyces euteiches]KAH9150180.1 hypothetical protein AeRB84_006940 [Aphanomyces euteiches]
MTKEDSPTSPWRTAAIGFAAGCVGGSMGIFVGQPFDTIKVRLQTHGAHYKGPLQCAQYTWQREGVRGFFKGLASPLIGSVPVNAIVFGMYGTTLQAIDPAPKPALSSIFYAGSFAGFLQSFVVCPTDLVKCQLQVQDGFTQKQYTGPLDCLRKITAVHGPRGLLQGLWPTLMRDSYSFGVYFFVYDAIQRWLESESTPTLLFAGGSAGVVSWTIIYPMDVIKSVIQTLPPKAPAHERRISYQAKRLLHQHGWRIFTAGLGTTVLRAFPVNAVTFYFYDWTVDALS